MTRDRFARQSLGSLHRRIKESRVLLVGAGGIGCELLKNLALTGFGEIHIVDLDTIDLSNLNRQFLFRHEHIKKSKALVAKESAAKFNSHVKLEAHHANIKDPQFNVDWFQQYNLVFNALDNLDARRHVNKMCLAANVPLIESGTTGFNGQVQVIIKGKTECYDCNTKEVPKTFPVCTIRSTPSQPIHCIVWSKSYLFTEIFGHSEDEAPEFDHSEDAENCEAPGFDESAHPANDAPAKEIENLRQEAQALNSIRQSMGSEEFPRKVFEKVFTNDINRLRSMEDMWKTRKRPNPLDFDTLTQASASISSSIASHDQRPWTAEENFAVFCDSMRRLSHRLKQSQASVAATTTTTTQPPPPVLTFDKDDEDTLDFVAASANLRSIIFAIEPKSKFDIKQMAGNIIPAIATTNAMTAALCVMQAFKVLREDLGKARMVFLERSGARVINSDTLKPPNPNCTICGVTSARLTIDPHRATLNHLVEDILKKQLGYTDELTINSEAGTLYDPDLDDNLHKKFGEVGVKADSFLTVVDDDDEEPHVNLSLSISEKSLPADQPPISFPTTTIVPRKTAPLAPLINGNTTTNGHISTAPAATKRKRSLSPTEDSFDATPNKKGKIQKMGDLQLHDNAPATMVIEDKGGSDGAIVIEDD